MKAIIGISSQLRQEKNRTIDVLNYTYINAVTKAGGLPIILPVMEDIKDIEKHMDILDGIIFSGGEDISPIYYNEEPLREVDTICYDRDITEFEQFRIAYKRQIPILGICRGFQLINVALGGSLYQDIHRQVPEAIGHSAPYNMDQGYHTIEIFKDTILEDILKTDRIMVNSNHHQAIKDLGKNLKVSAISKDNIIEAIESTNNNFLLAVEFHPEAMVERHEEFLDIFKYFIDKCK